MSRPRSAGKPPLGDAELVLGSGDTSLLDVVDNVLSKGVVLSGDLTIALAQVDLIYARVSLLLCAADRVLPAAVPDTSARRGERRGDREGGRPVAEKSGQPSGRDRARHGGGPAVLQRHPAVRRRRMLR